MSTINFQIFRAAHKRSAPAEVQPAAPPLGQAVGPPEAVRGRTEQAKERLHPGQRP